MSNNAQYKDLADSYVYYLASHEALSHIKALWRDKNDAQPSSKLTAKDYYRHLGSLGLVDPQSIQIHKTPQNYARAYLATNDIYEVPNLRRGEEKSYVIRVPVDYKGGVDAPKGARKLTPLQSEKAQAYLNSGGGWAQPMPINAELNIPPLHGTYLPDDYDEDQAVFVNRAAAPAALENTRFYRVPFQLSNKINQAIGDKKLKPLDEDELFIYDVLTNKGQNAPRLIMSGQYAYIAYDNVAADQKLLIDENLDLGGIKQAEKSTQWFRDNLPGSDYDGLEHVAYLKHVPAAEYAWLYQNEHERSIGIRPPLHAPTPMDDLFETNVFVAAGKSQACIQRILNAEQRRSEVEKELGHMLFGRPEVKSSFEVAGQSINVVDTKMHCAYENGQIIGIRCDWTPLYPNYTGMKNIDPPKGWVEVDGAAGVYRPDPDAVPEQAALFDQIYWPDYKDYGDVFGHDPIIKVQESSNTYSRAYQIWPHVHNLSVNGKPLNYIVVPEDYKEAVFRPTDSYPASCYEYQNFRSGCGDMYEPHMRILDEGVALPADYQASALKEDGGTKYFVLSGRSQKIYEAYERTNEEISDLRKAFVESVGAGGSYSYQGHKITSVEFTEQVPEHWIVQHKSGRTIEKEGEYVEVDCYTCVPDEASAEGREIKEQMESFSQELGFDDLQKSFTPDAPHMQKLRYEYFKNTRIFYYSMDEVDGEFIGPPDAIELPAALYGWVKQDVREADSGGVIPPMPAEVEAHKDLIDRLVSDAQESKAKPQAPKPTHGSGPNIH